ncbi:aminoacyl-tRNA hydrolase [Psychrobacillus psychrodurans]|jgi:PTH1 family peptidyl-tRNA hydrolase|uniref:Peptidyl-tRNA hydrolase n=1 Tax=Psychrobacillus psychrodurans TaxID=126157 RepID=A0A9X3LCC9_9BACI|nr:aminoacyl-tRNA hydrolase [Psychrobacillus psychrodurans]MCK1999535.1 aminoacyl-tRNA hydrolase [Psychrobacillus psychrodurans]MCZ8535358.1 aminoacyl-tRNA hydrolase [Psychrobacillus psychrodurans]MCZ8542073.1 aminoacyl-tRNA hydrolase [Psychrobacillus psychrodurans]SFN16014.1 peptidyl-tRNA hydrolase, PTH1 family [Psychrobacillus psychrodurans]
MKIIIGLGNPGKQYEGTRHNIGFHVIDELSNRLNIPLTQSKFNGMFGIGHIGTEKVMLLKPLTYMNLSGECIVPMMDYYEVNDDEIVVIYDDLDLQVGKLRLRQKGSAGGHNGIKSIIQHLGSQEFNRIRIGVDRPNNGMKVPDYVLSKFNENEKIEMIQAVKNSADACEDWFGKKFLDVMNTYNGA